jgi:L-lactate dehydrogenase complex protein LldE
MPTVALFVPCFIDQFYPRVAIAAVQVLEQLGIAFDVCDSAVCCGQPSANAGFADDGDAILARFSRIHSGYERVIVLSGSCAAHIRTHAARRDTRESTMEFCEFLHDEVGVDRIANLGATLRLRAAVHIGCHALRTLALAQPSEIQAKPFNKVRALLETVRGLSFIEPTRRDECCGFGGTFAVGEPEISTKMGRDRLRDYASHDAEIIVSTDVSCLMHLGGLARRAGLALPAVHVAEVLAGTVASIGATSPAHRIEAQTP